MIKLAIALGITSLLFLLSGIAYLLWSVALRQINPDAVLPAAFSIPMLVAGGVFVFANVLGGVAVWCEQRHR